MAIIIDRFFGQHTGESDIGSRLGLFRSCENFWQEGISELLRRPGFRDSGVEDPGPPFIAFHTFDAKDGTTWFLGWAVDGVVYAWKPTIPGQDDPETPIAIADFSNSDSGFQANNGQYLPQFETIKNVVYMSDGVSEMRVFSGLHLDSDGNPTSYRAGSPEAQTDWAEDAQTDITVSAGAGSISAGNHLVRYRYYNSVEGQPGKVSNQITIIASANDKITFQVVDGDDGRDGAIPLSDEVQIDQIIVEATAAGGSVFFEVGIVPNTDTATIAWESSDTELGQNTILYPVEEDGNVHGRPGPARLMRADKEVMFYLSDSTVGVDSGGVANNGTEVASFSDVVNAGSVLGFERVSTSVDTNYGSGIDYPGDATTESGYAVAIPRSAVKMRALVLGNKKYGGFGRKAVMAYVQRLRVDASGILAAVTINIGKRYDAAGERAKDSQLKVVVLDSKGNKVLSQSAVVVSDNINDQDSLGNKWVTWRDVDWSDSNAQCTFALHTPIRVRAGEAYWLKIETNKLYSSRLDRIWIRSVFSKDLWLYGRMDTDADETVLHNVRGKLPTGYTDDGAKTRYPGTPYNIQKNDRKDESRRVTIEEDDVDEEPLDDAHADAFYLQRVGAAIGKSTRYRMSRFAKWNSYSRYTDYTTLSDLSGKPFGFKGKGFFAYSLSFKATGSTEVKFADQASRTYITQSFLAGSTDLDSVALMLAKQEAVPGTIGGTLTIALYSDDGAGEPNASLVSTTIPIENITEELKYIAATLEQTVVAATRYHIVLDGSALTGNDSDNYFIVGVGTGYAGGASYVSPDGATWTSESTDLLFSAVAFNNGTASTFIITGASLPEAYTLVGRHISIDGSQPIKIASVSYAAGPLAYTVTADGKYNVHAVNSKFSICTLRRNQMGISLLGYPGSLNPNDFVDIWHGRSGIPSGFVVLGGALWIYGQQGNQIYNFDTENPTGGTVKESPVGRGLCSPNCAIKVGRKMYMFDDDGPWELNGYQEIPIKGNFSWLKKQIDWNSRTEFFGSYIPSINQVLWIVRRIGTGEWFGISLSLEVDVDGYTPMHVWVFDSSPTAMIRANTETGEDSTLIGTESGHTWWGFIGESDGLEPGDTSKLTVSSYSNASSDDEAIIYVNERIRTTKPNEDEDGRYFNQGLSGVSVYWVSGSEKAVIKESGYDSVSGKYYLVLDEPFPNTPSAGDAIILGRIPFRILTDLMYPTRATGRITLKETWRPKSLGITFRPGQRSLEFKVRVFKDFKNTPFDLFNGSFGGAVESEGMVSYDTAAKAYVLDGTLDQGYAEAPMMCEAVRYLRLEIFGDTPGTNVAIQGIELDYDDPREVKK